MRRSVFLLSLVFMTAIGAQDSQPEKAMVPTRKIINGITKKDTGVYKYFAWRYPTSFSCYIGKREIKPTEVIEIPGDKKNIVLAYAYSWHTPWGKKTGKKKARFKLNENAVEHTISFSGWKDVNRLHLSNAKKLSTEVPF